MINESFPLIGHQVPVKKGFRDGSLYNIIVLGISFCVLFTAFSPTQNLQTTLNKSVGSYSLSILYAFLSVSNFISPFVINSLGERLSLIVGALAYSVYIAANIKILEPTLFIAAGVLGVGGAILWTAQGSFVIQCSTESTIGFNTGLFFALFQLNQVIGNLGTQQLLKAHIAIQTLFIIILSVSLFSLVGFALLGKPIKTDDKGVPIPKENANLPMKDRLLATIILIKDRPIQLLVPALLYSGISQSFFFGVFPSLSGANWLGYIMAVFGACDAIGSVLIGKLSDIIGRKILVFICTLFCIAGSILAYFVNTRLDNQPGYYFICAALLGFADAGFNTQLYSLIGAIYPQKGEAAAGFFKFVQSTATAIAFGYGPYAILLDHICIINGLVVLSCVLFMFADNFSKRSNIDELTV
ncbi:hypothetical protein DICPUDRAFT_92306 [Dictyostelium purpureum]|uniref:UNC93-like protein MFSD11 n=1 Tax=Dictyostelium purpureum TaxID=5786 RepID=F0ZPY6_DICPU|nr:uncharacterized protein DICPUDRAFT_92306 [Dictyostelium purpureum]EGC33987.1 hypothetical protein DICPUDRAFT_92306 [Dictyostelium purpureum]|eukprot:XP_003289473.1 hypothetical protein DICPUDRAFT_92306 [Dictyostelium purpureum]